MSICMAHYAKTPLMRYCRWQYITGSDPDNNVWVNQALVTLVLLQVGAAGVDMGMN